MTIGEILGKKENNGTRIFVDGEKINRYLKRQEMLDADYVSGKIKRGGELSF